jgi:hypothetical protein
VLSLPTGVLLDSLLATRPQIGDPVPFNGPVPISAASRACTFSQNVVNAGPSSCLRINAMGAELRRFDCQ